MDPISAQLTNAWLEAVVRLDAPATALPARIGPAQNLAQVFENTLREAGARNPGQRIDRLV